MVRRPNELKKESLKKSNKTAEPEEPVHEEHSGKEMTKKESCREQEEKVEPVTHYISKAMHTGNDEIIEQEHEEIVRECVKLSEESLLKTFFKKLAVEEENQFNDKLSMNVSNHASRVDSLESSSYSSSNEYK
jgi:hypothetical protein